MKINLRKVRKKLEIMNAFWNFPTDSLSIGRYPSPVLYPSGRGQLQGSGLVQGWNSDRLQFLAATRSQIVVFLPRAWCHRLKLVVCTNFPPVFRPFPGPHNWDWTRVCPYSFSRHERSIAIFAKVVPSGVVLFLICLLCVLRRSLTRLEGMEGKLKTTEWSIDEVYEKIKENYNEEVAKKFKGEFDTRL